MMLASGSLSKEVDPLLNAIREQKPRALIEFFKDRGIILEKGGDFIDALIKRIIDSNKREKLNQIATALVHSRGFETTEQMVERFKLALEKVKDM